jgi:hypothetical protein
LFDFGYSQCDDNGDLHHAKVIRLFVTQEQISKFNIPLEFDAEVSVKIFGTSIPNGDEKDKKENSRTAGYIERYRSYMKPGYILPPTAELDAMLSTNELPDETKAILDENISPFFNEIIYQQEVTDTLQTRKNELTEFLEMKVKFLDDDNEE